MKLKYHIIIHVLLFLFVVIYIDNSYAKEFTISDKDYMTEYNVVYLDMDKAFSYLKEVYNLKTDSELADELSKLFLYKKPIGGSCNSENINYAFRKSSNDKIVISKDNKTIPVPDIYVICEKNEFNSKIVDELMIDDSVKVEMVVKNNKYYLPTYFFSNIPGVTVKIDGIEVYQANNYVDSIGALKKNSNSHSIKLIVNKITNYNSISKTIGKFEYYGMEDGALWREEAKKRIEKNRKKDLNINVKDKNGNNINNATVKIEMIDNSFKFGTALSRQSSGTSHYFNYNGMEITKEYFNVLGSTAVFTPYHYGARKQDARNQLITDGKKIGINYFRGHNLYWDHWNDKSLCYGEGLKTIGDIVGKNVLVKDKDGKVNCVSDTDYLTNKNYNKITMSYVRYKFDEFNKDGKYTDEEKKQINEWVKELKDRFEDFVHKYIETTLEKNPEVNEWDIFNELANTIYFRYYLYGEDANGNKNFLTAKVVSKDGTYPFLDTHKYSENGGDEYDSQKLFNERFKKSDYNEFLDFLVGCIEVYRANTNKLMVINESKVNGVFSRVKDNKSAYQAQWLFELLNKKLQDEGMKTIDAIGFENHVHARYYMTPNSYYNAYNKFLNKVGVSKGRITEYDMCDEKNNCFKSEGNDFKKEEQVRAKYLTDTLISTYSNSKMDLFMTWTITHKFSKAEQDAYKKTVREWLNYSKEFKTSNGNLKTRLYSGKYKVTVTVNGKKVSKEVNLTSSSNNINFTFDSSTSTSNTILGDVNGNGKVGAQDYILIRKHILNLSILTSDNLKRADVNNDEKVSALDYVMVRKIILGLIKN